MVFATGKRTLRKAWNLDIDEFNPSRVLYERETVDPIIAPMCTMGPSGPANNPGQR